MFVARGQRRHRRHRRYRGWVEDDAETAQAEHPCDAVGGTGQSESASCGEVTVPQRHERPEAGCVDEDQALQADCSFSTRHDRPAHRRCHRDPGRAGRDEPRPPRAADRGNRPTRTLGHPVPGFRGAELEEWRLRSACGDDQGRAVRQGRPDPRSRPSSSTRLDVCRPSLPIVTGRDWEPGRGRAGAVWASRQKPRFPAPSAQLDLNMSVRGRLARSHSIG